MERFAPLVATILVVVAYFSIRFLSAVHATDDILKTSGFLQRHDAFEKVLRYDDWMDTRVRRGGIFKQVILWPIKPSDEEIQIASQYLGVVIEIADHLLSTGAICPSEEINLSDNLETASHFSYFLSEKLEAEIEIEESNSLIFVHDSFLELFPCPE